MIVVCGSERRHVEVERAAAEGTLLVTVDGHRVEAYADRVAEGIYRVRLGDRHETIRCVVDGTTIHLYWRGRAYRLERETAPRGPRPEPSGTLTAPMPGRILEVRVAAGQEVVRGQALLVIEAMKMENVVRAPRDGHVDRVHVEAGARVTAGAILLELASAAAR